MAAGIVQVGYQVFVSFRATGVKVVPKLDTKNKISLLKT